MRPLLLYSHSSGSRNLKTLVAAVAGMAEKGAWLSVPMLDSSLDNLLNDDKRSGFEIQELYRACLMLSAIMNLFKPLVPESPAPHRSDFRDAVDGYGRIWAP